MLFLIPADSENARQAYDVLLEELRQYNPELLDKQRVIGLSKADLADTATRRRCLDELPAEVPKAVFSALTGEGIQPLKDLLWATLNLPAYGGEAFS